MNQDIPQNQAKDKIFLNDIENPKHLTDLKQEYDNT